jgi:hypothetical protein
MMADVDRLEVLHEYRCVGKTCETARVLCSLSIFSNGST